MKLTLKILPLLIAGGALAQTAATLEQRAAKGEPKALFMLAQQLEQGRNGEAADTLRAFALYRQAADSLYAPALNYLGYSYFSGNSALKANPDSGLKLIEQAAQLGDAKACNNLGWILSHGEGGIKTDMEQARRWYDKAISLGSAPAMQGLASILLTEGERQQAFALLDSAAYRGFKPAMRQILTLRDSLFRATPTPELVAEASRYYHNGAPELAAALYMSATERTPLTPADTTALAEAFAITALARAQGSLLTYNYDDSLMRFFTAACMGSAPAQFIVAETLEMLPDAFSDLPIPPSLSSRLDTPAHLWRSQAAQAGVSDSHTAFTLLSP